MLKVTQIRRQTYNIQIRSDSKCLRSRRIATTTRIANSLQHTHVAHSLATLAALAFLKKLSLTSVYVSDVANYAPL
ncbi:hypothetical protein WN51_02858 [Melipona quadrifasciata]|uniref:Uncharacterized protein n=1 Tax=Melipona quadrifasciata TaxID=166423 RepID=A0A0N0BJT6_9HYME|nr:hypothetical protein WN51_02858 [Melipona quadrifasciata]